MSKDVVFGGEVRSRSALARRGPEGEPDVGLEMEMAAARRARERAEVLRRVPPRRWEGVPGVRYPAEVHAVDGVPEGYVLRSDASRMYGVSPEWMSHLATQYAFRELRIKLDGRVFVCYSEEDLRDFLSGYERSNRGRR